MFILYNSKEMNIRIYYFIGFFFTSISLCKSDSGCPNEPVTPLPTQTPSTECPNVSVTPSPVKEATKPVTVSTTTTPQISGCGNQIESQAIQNGSKLINQTCSFSVPLCLMQLCCQGCCCLIGTEITTTPPTSITFAPPPEALIKCPPGTILLERRCHLLYCPQGSQMINDRCIVIECPEGTVWTGHSCSLPEPIVQNLKFKSNILTQFYQTKPQIVLNNTNNIFVDASLNLRIDTDNKNDCSYENSDCKEATIETTPVPDLNCCEVMTPRICKQYNNSWRCYSRRSRKCGEFCVAPIIYLKPSRMHATREYLVMPPIQNNCQSFYNCGKEMGGYDCSGCASNDMEHCSYYCYRYNCPSRRCEFYDQEKYCTGNTSLYGCQVEDGCFASWCI